MREGEGSDFAIQAPSPSLIKEKSTKKKKESKKLHFAKAIKKHQKQKHKEIL